MTLTPVPNDDPRYPWLDTFFDSLYGYSELEDTVLYTIETGQVLSDDLAEKFHLDTYGMTLTVEGQEHNLLVAYLVANDGEEGVAQGVSITPLALDDTWFLGKMGPDIMIRAPVPGDLIDHVIRATDRAEFGETLADGDAPDL